MRRHAPLILGILIALSTIACGPAQLRPEQIVAAFIAASQDEARTFHMEWQGTAEMGQGTRPDEPGTLTSINATFDFSGDDYAGTIVINWTGGGTSGTGGTTDYARVGGAVFQKFEGGGWERADGVNGVPAQFDPMFGLGAADVSYVGPDTVDARSVHQLRVLDPAAAMSRSFFAARDDGQTPVPAGQDSDFAIFVDGQGIPISAQLRLAVSMGASGDDPGNPNVPPMNYDIAFEFRFTEWGSPLTISAPPLTGGGGIDDMPPPPMP